MQTLDVAATRPRRPQGHGDDSGGGGAYGGGAAAATDGGTQALGIIGADQQNDAAYEAFVTSERAPVRSCCLLLQLLPAAAADFLPAVACRLLPVAATCRCSCYAYRLLLPVAARDAGAATEAAAVATASGTRRHVKLSCSYLVACLVAA
jgi:hypothetical protein